MRTEFLFSKETKKEEYFTKAAVWIDSIRNGKTLTDGRNLQEELSEVEQQEYQNYLMELLLPEIETIVRFKRKHTGLDEYKTEELQAILSMKVFEDFYKFNNKDFLSDEEKRYTISTFIDHKAREAMREMLIQERGLPVNAIRNLRHVINAIITVSDEEEISTDVVTPEQVFDLLQDKSISFKMVVTLMDIYHGNTSIDDMEDSDERLQDITANVEDAINDELDNDTRAALDEVFNDFSKLELYIMMKEFGFLGERIRKMTAKELSYQDYFVDMAREDRDGEKNIEFGDVQIKRPGRNSGIIDEVLVESVYYVKEKFYSNKVAKIKKKLAALGDKILITDIEGCLDNYCMKVWKERFI